MLKSVLLKCDSIEKILSRSSQIGFKDIKDHSALPMFVTDAPIDVRIIRDFFASDDDYARCLCSLIEFMQTF